MVDFQLGILGYHMFQGSKRNTRLLDFIFCLLFNIIGQCNRTIKFQNNFLPNPKENKKYTFQFIIDSASCEKDSVDKGIGFFFLTLKKDKDSAWVS